MTGGDPPAQVIVIHGRQIVMNQRVGVDTLKSTSQRQQWFSAGRQGLGGGQAENRPDPLAPGQKTVAHGLNMIGQRPRIRRQQRFQSLFDFRLPIGEIFFYIHMQILQFTGPISKAIAL